MKLHQRIGLVFAAFMLAALTACGTTPPTTDGITYVQAGVSIVKVALKEMQASGKLTVDELARIDAIADNVLTLLPVVNGAIALADPKLAPALAKLNELNVALLAAKNAAGG